MFRIGWAIAGACLFVGCPCKKSDDSPDAEVSIIAVAPQAPREAREESLERLWTAAESGESDDLLRLANAEGGIGLVEGADAAHRKVAVRAAAFCHDWVALPWLAELAEGDDQDLAQAALESVIDRANARAPNRAPEDAIELREGCDRLQKASQNAKLSAPRKVLYARALLLLKETGCLSTKALAAPSASH